MPRKQTRRIAPVGKPGRRRKRSGDSMWQQNNKIRSDVKKPLTTYTGTKFERSTSFGSTAYDTVVEEYNSDSEWRRWRMGYELYAQGLMNFIQNAEEFTFTLSNGQEVKLQVYSFPNTYTDSRVHWVTVRRPNEFFYDGQITGVTEDDENFYVTTTRVLSAAEEIYIGDRLGDGLDASKNPIANDDVMSAECIGIDTTLNRFIFAKSGRAGRFVDTKDPDRTQRNFIVGRYMTAELRVSCSCPDASQRMYQNVQDPEVENKFDFARMPVESTSSLTKEVVEGKALLDNADTFRSWRDYEGPIQIENGLLVRKQDVRICKHQVAVLYQEGLRVYETDDLPTTEVRDRTEKQVAKEVEARRSYLKNYVDMKARREIFTGPLFDTVAVITNENAQDVELENVNPDVPQAPPEQPPTPPPAVIKVTMDTELSGCQILTESGDEIVTQEST